MRGRGDQRAPTVNDQAALDLVAMKVKKLTRTCMWIWSKPLIQALRSSIGYYPTFDRVKNEWPLGIFEPYTVLIHHYQWINNFVAQKGRVPYEHRVEDGVDSDLEFDWVAAAEDMIALRNFLKERYESFIVSGEARLSGPVPRLSFDMIPYLFRPGIDIYVQDGGEVYVCVVKSVNDNTFGYGQYPPSAQEKLKYFVLHLWYLDTDGTMVSRVAKKHQITQFQDFKEVLSLPVCPAQIWDALDGGARRAQILQRSVTHVEALRAGRLHIQYDGPDLTTRSLVRAMGRYHVHLLIDLTTNSFEGRWWSTICVPKKLTGRFWVSTRSSFLRSMIMTARHSGRTTTFTSMNRVLIPDHCLHNLQIGLEKGLNKTHDEGTITE